MKRLFSLSAICLCVSMMAMIASVSADDPGAGEEGGGETTINDKCTNPPHECHIRVDPCHVGNPDICGSAIAPATDCDCAPNPTFPSQSPYQCFVKPSSV